MSARRTSSLRCASYSRQPQKSSESTNAMQRIHLNMGRVYRASPATQGRTSLPQPIAEVASENADSITCRCRPRTDSPLDRCDSKSEGDTRSTSCSFVRSTHEVLLQAV